MSENKGLGVSGSSIEGNISQIRMPDIKYQYYQQVWINSTVKAKTFICRSLKVLCTYNGYSADGWGVTTHVDNSGKHSGGMPYRVFYSEVDNPGENDWVSQELLFATKEDLLNSL